MTTQPDLERLIESFFEEGPRALPVSSYDAVRTAIDRTRQRFVIGPWREEQIMSTARYALAAAAVVLVAVVGVRFLPDDSGIGVQPSATPTQAATPTPAPSPVALPRIGELAAGSYFIADIGVTNVERLTFTVADGWNTTTDTFLFRDEGAANEVMFSTWVITHIFADACNWDESVVIDVGSTPDELVSALAAQQGRDAGPVTDTTIDGYPAKRIELTVPADLDTATCNGNLRYWPDPGPNFGGGLCCNPPGNTDVVYAVDVNGSRLVLVARHYPGSSSADLTELQGLIDSIQIEP